MAWAGTLEEVDADLSRVSGQVKSTDEKIATINKGAIARSKKGPLARPTQLDSSPESNAIARRRVLVVLEEGMDPREPGALGQVGYTYEKVFPGLSLELPENRVKMLQGMKGVRAVYADELVQPDTDASPQFIGAPALWSRLGGQGSAGEGVVIGVLDTGVWPEHPSFADDGSYSIPPVSVDACDFGNTGFNGNDAPFACNNKLIGAYTFLDTYKQAIGLLPKEFDSARDAVGHGSHTASTAGGNAGVKASIFGVRRGTISGIAPRAHLIAYKVCGGEGCFSSDVVAAVEQAIKDGVDLINFSIGGGENPYSEINSLAFLAAYQQGIFVAASAGNEGPSANSVGHREPWTTTVAASTSDRHFLSTVTLTAGTGETLALTGASVTAGIDTPTAVVLASDFGDGQCLEPFPSGTFDGEIVICERGVIARVAKSFNVAQGGAGGLLLYNPSPQGLNTDNHFIPSVHLDFDEGQALLSFMEAHSDVTGTFPMGEAARVPGDVLAPFSSRGGPEQTLGVSKPDLTAPGVQILAGHSPMPATENGGVPGELFQSIQGTSMSSPHVAGAAALLKHLHPEWTPGQIRSALMTTARSDVTKEDGTIAAGPFDTGSGSIDLANAAEAVLTFPGETAEQLLALETELWNANYPSLYIPIMPGEIAVRRTVHNSADRTCRWRLLFEGPDDIRVDVPRTLSISGNADATFDIAIDARFVPIGEMRTGRLLMEPGGIGRARRANCGPALHVPISLVRGQADVLVAHDCAPTEISKRRRETTACTINLENTSFREAEVSLVDVLPRNLKLDEASVEGADVVANGIGYQGTLAATSPPDPSVTIDVNASPFGYVSLADFAPYAVTATDESIDVWDVPSFTYAGQTYSQIGIVSNGYIVVGGGTLADVRFLNARLPEEALPNNVLSPFWTDLNPDAGGRVLLNVLTDGADQWIVVGWEGVPNFGDGRTNTFQVWIGTDADAHPDEDISFVYSPDVSDGDGGLLTVGAENAFGNKGGTVYFNGEGIAPASTLATGYVVDVLSVPGAPGGSHTIAFEAKGKRRGAWTSCAEMTSDITQGTSIDCVEGRVTR